MLILSLLTNQYLQKMKKFSLNDFAKANVTLEKKVMKSVKGGDGIPLESWSWGITAQHKDKWIVVESSSIG